MPCLWPSQPTAQLTYFWARGRMSPSQLLHRIGRVTAGVGNVKTTAALLIGWLAVATSWADTSAAIDYSQETGEHLYRRYCAACHGTSGQGDGEVAPALKVAVPDLTLLAVRNGNRFPAARVSEIIDGRVWFEAHGTRSMPVWGQQFAVDAGNDSQAEYTVRTMVERLVNYLRRIQRPPVAPE
jgi:mono/diheme cytochrome c family protein